MVDCLYNCHCKELSAGDRIGIPYLKIGISVLGRNPTQTKGKLSRLKVAIGVKAANYCLMNYQVKFKPKAIKDLESLPLVEVKKMLGLQRVYEINTFILVRVGGLCLCSRDFNRLDIFYCAISIAWIFFTARFQSPGYFCGIFLLYNTSRPI